MIGDLKFTIGCRVSGGMTGTRQSVLKDSRGVATFDTREAALAEIERLRAIDARLMGSAVFNYWVIAPATDSGEIAP